MMNDTGKPKILKPAPSEMTARNMAASKPQIEEKLQHRAKKERPAKFKKNPHAPKRFKSAFIIFSAEKHQVIRDEATAKDPAAKGTNVAKLVSEAWKKLSPEEKSHWEERSCKDKARYEVEKAMYSGPWKVPANIRKQKNPDAPKRPMSAFLAFSNKRRGMVKAQNPDASNAELSKILSTMWKEADEDLRKLYVDEEAGLREKYHLTMNEWRKKEKDAKTAKAKQSEDMALGMLEAQQQLGAQSEALNPLSRSTPRSQNTRGTHAETKLAERSDLRRVHPNHNLHQGALNLLGVPQAGLGNIPGFASVATRPRGIDELIDAGLAECLPSQSLASRLSAAFGPRMSPPYQSGILSSYQEASQAQLNANLLAQRYNVSAGDVESFMANRGIEGTSNVTRGFVDGFPSSYYGGHASGTFLDHLSPFTRPSLLERDGFLPRRDWSENHGSIISQASADALFRYRTQQNTNPLDQFLGLDFRVQSRRGFDNDNP